MKAIQVRSIGGPEVLELHDLPDPVPLAGEVLVRVHTSGVNFIDVYYREGKYRAPLPFIPGGEGSGHVETLGEGVSDLAVGDRVAWWGPLGSYAEKTVIAAKTLVKVPSGVDLESAAALMVQGATAYYLSHLTFPLNGEGAFRRRLTEYCPAAGQAAARCSMVPAMDRARASTWSCDSPSTMTRMTGSVPEGRSRTRPLPLSVASAARTTSSAAAR